MSLINAERVILLYYSANSNSYNKNKYENCVDIKRSTSQPNSIQYST